MARPPGNSYAVLYFLFEEDKYFMISLLCAIFKKLKTNKKKQIHRYENRLVVSRGRRWEVGEMGESVQKAETSCYK